MRSRIEERLVVIGGGVIGLTVAARALENDARTSVTVLERDQVGCGASGFAGAMDVPYCPHPVHRTLVDSSASWYAARASPAEHRLPVPISWFAGSEDEERRLREQVRGALSVRTGSIPGLRAPPGHRVLDGESFALRPPPWCRELKRRIEASGRGVVLEKTPAVSFDVCGTEVRTHTAGGDVVRSGRAIVCLGPWLSHSMPELATFAASHRLRNKRVSGLRVRLAADSRPWRAIGWPERGIFFLPYGRTGLHAMSIQHDEWGVVPSEPGELPEPVRERAREFLDSLVGPRGWTFVEDCQFMDTYSPSFTPLVASLPDTGGRVSVITGTHGSGVRLAPGLAQWALSALEVPEVLAATS